MGRRGPNGAEDPVGARREERGQGERGGGAVQEPKPPKAGQSQKEAGLSPAEPLPPSPPPETPEGARDEEEPAEAPPPEQLRIQVESTEPLPPAEGDWALLLRLRRGSSLCWQGALPPGEYLLSPPGRQGAPPPLPRLLLPAGAALGRGLLLSSAPRGLFLRLRPGDGPGPATGTGTGTGTVRGPHEPHGPLLQGALLQPFDARRFREELELHRAGRGPRPPLTVTLELGAPGGGGALLLELEQAFARRLLDTLGTPPGPPPDK